MAVIERLKEVALFAGLDPDALAKLGELCTIRTYQEGVLLFYEEDYAGHLHLLLSGELRVYKTDRMGNEIFLYFLEPGDLVTEFESFDRPACFANLGFTEPSEMLLIDANRFREFMRRHCELMEAVMGAFIAKTGRLQCALNRETVFDTTAKVAHFIRHQPEAFNRLKKQAIAARLNIQPETLSRVLRKLIRDKIIIVKGDEIVIPDVKQLELIYR